jgi:hypothetical protein
LVVRIGDLKGASGRRWHYGTEWDEISHAAYFDWKSGVERLSDSRRVAAFEQLYCNMIFGPLHRMVDWGVLLVAVAVMLGVTLPFLARAQTASMGHHLDANGWIVFTRSADTRTIYVSSSTGSDRNTGLTPDSAVATITAGKARLRNGYPDELLLRAGDTFVKQSFGYLTVSGRSATEPLIIGVYGTGPAPIVETPANGGVGIGSLPGKGGNFIVVEGIDFYAYQRDPSNPAYAGPNTSALGTNFLNPNTWVVLTGNKFSFFSTNIVFNSSNSRLVTSSRAILYRNVVTDAWSANSHSQGLYAAGMSSLVVEQNVFDHNGWNASIPGAEATIYNRNIYFQFNNNEVTFTGNISANSSSEGAQFRSGGTISDNLFVADSDGFDLGHLEGEPTITSAVATGNVILNSTDIHTSSGLLPRNQGINVFNATGSGVQVTRNIIAHAAGSPINEGGIILDATTTGVRATDNIIYDVSNPILNLGNNNFTSPNSTNLLGYPDPTRTVETYNASIGGNPNLSAFLMEARRQSKSTWRPRYMATAVINYILAGFGVN